jgi:hypothetical protein
MTIHVFGNIELSCPEISQKRQDDIAFQVVLIATQHKIGIKMGGNISRHAYDQFHGKPKTIMYELTSTPEDDNAHTLFIGEGPPREAGVDYSESLTDRLSRVKVWVNVVFAIKEVERIHMNISPQSDELTYAEFRVDDFMNSMLELFKKGWTPHVNITIYR